MFELPVTSYSQVRAMFAPIDYHLGPQAVLAGNLPGVVLVDDPGYPRAALTWLKHRVYLAGQPGDGFINAVRELLHTRILPEARANRHERFLLYYAPSAEDQAAALLAGQEHTREWRLELEFAGLIVDWRQLLPEKLLLQQVDEWLLRSPGIIGKDAIIQAYTSEHPSLEDALQREFGYCLLRRRLIVARCLSEYAGEGRCEFGIMTHPDYRKQGLGTIVAAAMVERAQFLGFSRTGWHCWEKNRASSALAEKVGFVLKNRYPVLTGRML
jgi:RimJ/RimL family protein N-acetyltransferase